MPCSTAWLTPAVPARTAPAWGSISARAASTRLRAGVIRTLASAAPLGGSARIQPADSGSGAVTRSAIAITSPGGDSV